MDLSTSLTQTLYDYKTITSIKKWTRGNVNINSLELIGKETTIYRYDESIPFRVDILTKVNIDQLHLRMEIHYNDMTPVGTVPDILLGQIDKEQSTSYIVNFKTKNLTRGKYRMNLVLFQIDEYGNSFDENLIFPAFTFSIEDNEKIIWNQNTWGHIRFDGELLNIQ